MTGYAIVLGLLFTGFYLLFFRIRWLELVKQAMQRTRWEMNESARRRLLADRRKLLLLQQENTIWYRLERELYYSGWKRRMPFLTVEVWLLCNGIAMIGTFLLVLFSTGKWLMAGGGMIIFVALEYLFLHICKAGEFCSVNENLLKLLNFLGNYSITVGEVTSVFSQVSKYVEEPVKSVLSECCYEAQTTGDAGMALLVMAEKIQHPKFKELAYNMEVSIRYCADFKALVEGSRHSVREYLRMKEEQKGILREALINIILLLVMSVFSLIAVDGLIDSSIWDVLFGTFPGHVALLVTGVIFLCLVRKLLGLNQ